MATRPHIDSITPPGPIKAEAGSKVVVVVSGHTHKLDDRLELVAETDDGTPVSVEGMTATIG